MRILYNLYIAAFGAYLNLRIAIARRSRPESGRKRFIALFGGPGAGKGTLAGQLAAYLGLPHLNMGNIIRREIKEQTEIGRVWGPRVKAGRLIPDSVILYLLKRELEKPEYARGAILDGIPRTAYQARKLCAMLAAIGERLEAALLLDVTIEDMLERLALRRTCTNSACARSYHLKFLPPRVENTCDACGSSLAQRDDEKPEAIRVRMEEFSGTFGKLRRYYEARKLMKVVKSTNAMGPEVVFANVCAMLAA